MDDKYIVLEEDGTFYILKFDTTLSVYEKFLTVAAPHIITRTHGGGNSYRDTALELCRTLNNAE